MHVSAESDISPFILKVLPFYFPTSVIMVDDDSRFLEHCSLLFGRWLTIRHFSSASAALQYLRQQKSIFPVRDHPVSENDTLGGDKLSAASSLILHGLHEVFYQSSRFATAAVVMVDYVMPEMDGLELLSQLHNSGIKRVLLTGQADESLAVTAFNRDLIDRFFFKDAIVREHSKIEEEIKRLQQQFFAEQLSALLPQAYSLSHTYLNCQDFSRFFHTLTARQHVIEQCLLADPPGFLLLNERGKTSFLLVVPDVEMHSYYEVADSDNADRSILQVIGDRIAIPCVSKGLYDRGVSRRMPRQSRYLLPSDASGAQDIDSGDIQLYPVQFTFAHNEVRYFCSLVTPAPAWLFDPERMPLRGHLDYLESL